MNRDNLTNDQLEALKQVNTRLKNLQDKLLQEAIVIDNNLRARVDDKRDILYDYELEYTLYFCLNFQKVRDNSMNIFDDIDGIWICDISRHKAVNY